MGLARSMFRTFVGESGRGERERETEREKARESERERESQRSREGGRDGAFSSPQVRGPMWESRNDNGFQL